MEIQWNIQLLGALSAQRYGEIITRFPTRKVGALLAYLAYFRQSAHPREVLIEMLWPESDLEAGRKSLSVALSSLRHHLEPPGVVAGSVLITDHFAVRINPETVTTDVALFEADLAAAAQTTDEARQRKLLSAAVEKCHGPLLPGYYEAWIPAEHERLNERLYQALLTLAERVRSAGNSAGALEYARRALSLDRLREDAHQSMIRLYAATDQLSAALRHYRELERLLREELGTAPSAATRALVEHLRDQNRVGAVFQASEANMKTRGEGAPALLEASSPAKLPGVSSALKASRIPVPLTRFFGRQEETVAIDSLLRTPHTRLVTLTGLGGSGKTRLAIEVADRLMDTFQGRVWFVPLAELVEARLIPDRILNVLGLPRLSDREPLHQLIEALSSLPTLLILDNFEHLVEEGAPQLQILLTRVPNLICLVTSQQRLNLSGEQEFAVLPLPTPRPDDLPERLLQVDSVQLFVDRAQQVHPDFQVTPANADAIAQLCYRLEGIPLALELAAARTQVLTIDQMLSQLERRFTFLVSRRRDAEVRHRTLRAAVDWSYRLLPPELQRFFAQLSVFRGGWTMEAAAAICEEPMALDYLEYLKDCSLVLVTENAGEMRFQMLETLREYTRELLSVEALVALHQRHRDWFLALAEETEPDLQGSEQVRCLLRLEQEYDNLRLALEWCHTEENGAEKGARLAGALWRFWSLRGSFTEGQERFDRALSRAVSPAVRAKALLGAGELAHYQGEYARAEPLLEESLALFRRQQDLQGVAQALRCLGLVTFAQGQFAAARALAEESLALFRELDDSWGIACALNNLGDMVIDPPSAIAFQQQSLLLFRERGDKQGIANALMSLGEIAGNQGDIDTASELAEESLSLFRELGNSWGMAASLLRLGDLALERQDLDTGEKFYADSLEVARKIGNKWDMAVALDRLAGVAGRRNDSVSARALFQKSLEIMRATGNRFGIATLLACIGRYVQFEGEHELAYTLLAESVEILRELGNQPALVRSQMGLARNAMQQEDYTLAESLLRESLSVYQELEDYRGVSHCLTRLAACALSKHKMERAAGLLGAAEAIREISGHTLSPEAWAEFEQHVATVQDALSEDVFDALWKYGRSLSPDQALTLDWEQNRILQRLHLHKASTEDVSTRPHLERCEVDPRREPLRSG